MTRAMLFLLLSAICSCALGAVMQLNCGGAGMVGTDWMGDNGEYVNGTTKRYVVAGPIDAMDYKSIYKSHCFVPTGDLLYTIPVRMAKFKVSLLFAETYLGSGPDFRLFNVAVNDVGLMYPLDVYKKAGNKYNKGIKIVFTTMPKDGFITVSLTRIAGKNNPFISGIVLEYDNTPMDMVSV